MNNLNNSADEVVECPLCMEPLEVDDLNFFPCTCGYQICRFCWHRIRTDENELCPACRKEYPENPADFKPLTQEEMIAFKSQKRQRDQQRKQKITENRKHLANVRVVQKNLVFVVGLPPRLADADILKKHEYFGKYGKIHKVVINPSTAYAGVQGPSASAYVTYVHNTDALRAIQSVNNIMIDGRLIKTSLGTTKYCSHFMKNQQCPKADCMYLHELGDPEASFTKEEMHQGKHQEYEKRLHDVLIASTGTSSSGCSVSVGSTSSMNNNKNSDSCKINNTNSLQSHNSSVSSNANTSSVSSAIQKEAWPSLSISPVSQKESLPINNNKNKKERTKQEKNKSEKNTKSKNNKSNNNMCPNSTSKDLDVSVTISNSTLESSITNNSSTKSSKFKEEKNKDKNLPSLENRSNSRKESTIVEDVIKDFDKRTTNTFPSTDNNNEDYFCNKIRNVNNVNKVVDNQRSLSSSSNSSSSCVINTSENNSTINESVSGKSSPGSFHENNFNDEHTTKVSMKYDQSLTPSSVVETNSECNTDKNNLSENRSDIYGYVENLIKDGKNNDQEMSDNHIDKMNFNESLLKKNEEQDSVTDAVSKLNLLDENSFFTSTKGVLHQSPMSLKTKNNDQIIPNQHNTGTVPNLPDLINGIDGYQNTANEFHNSSNNYLAGSDLNRQSSYLQFQQQSSESSNDNLLQNSLFGTNMSKFFDFHKHQQQKLQQHCLQISGSNNINSGVNENLLMMPLMENSLNSQLVDPNCILTSQNHQKQKLFGKIDQMLCHQPHPNQQIGPLSTQQNQYMHSAIGDDELGFDPFIETQKALAELIENEEEQQNSGTSSSKVAHKTGSNNHQHHQQHISEYVQRARMPPPGFNHVTNFNGYGVVPRIQNSKVMPFMNISNNYAVPTGQHIQPQQQLQIPSNAWGTHLGNFQQQINEQQMRQVNSNQMQNTTNQKGYTGNDWTAMDPAILSFRQFSFPHQTQITPQIQPQQQEIFLQQLAQQQAGFNSQSQHINGGNVGIPNTIMNTQQNSQPHVNANVQGMLEYLKTRQFV